METVGVNKKDIVREYIALQVPGIQAKSDTKKYPLEFVVRYKDYLLLLLSNKSQRIKKTCMAVLFVAYMVYFGFAIRHNFEGAKALIVLTSLALAMIAYVWLRNTYGAVIWDRVCIPMTTWYIAHEEPVQWMTSVLFILAIVLYLALGVIESAIQLQSLGGMFFCIFLPWITCKHPEKIKWRPVVWGFGLQFVIGVLVLRWPAGYRAIEWLSNEINKFLFYSLDGAAVVFGDPWFILHPFAMLVVSLVVYIGAVLAVMYYFGLTQAIAGKIGWCMSITLHTTAIESVSLAANIFLSVLDTVLMLKSYIPQLTPSELHTFLVGAHSTIAGFAFGLFILFGVSPQHLLTGAVMSAPAAVAIAKLNFPETQPSHFSSDKFELKRGTETNVFEAFSNGAKTAGIGVVALAMQIIAFYSLFIFLDSTLMWLGQRIGAETNMERLLGYCFTPVAFLLGVQWDDCMQVGSLLGIKVLANEFLSFIELGQLNVVQAISTRSSAIATYAMCGFSSLGTLAMFVGVWKPLNTGRSTEAAQLIPRILMNANLSCFMTACVVGVMYTDEIRSLESEPNPRAPFVLSFFERIPSYKEFLPRF